MKAVVKVGILVSLVFAEFGLIIALTKPTSIKFIDNAYSGVVVAIHRDVQENSTLVEAIKGMFIEGSSYLYNATKHRAFFESITILIPQTWSSKPEYQQASNESYTNADILIATEPNPVHQTNPYTKQYQGCGKRGVNINFLDVFFLDPKAREIYGSPGRVLVHEWGHYRWGLFNEYPDAIGDPDNYQEFYLDNDKWEGVRCSLGYSGTALKFYDDDPPEHCNGNSLYDGYEPGCVFVPSPLNATGSIMYGRLSYNQIVNFCDNDDTDPDNFHNQEAPNKHNRLCQSKSCWEVMRETIDFVNGNNPPRKIDAAHLVPDFILVQPSFVRVVLVLDVSGSMRETRFDKMISACNYYISNVVLDEAYVGIVKFTEYAVILSDLTLVVSDEDRIQLLMSLPEGAGGGTCIGCGLIAGIQVLRAFGNPKGGTILLLSDGEDSNFPSDNDVNAVLDAGVIVDAIAFSQDGDGGMFFVAKQTGGNSFYYSDEPGDSSLHDALSATMQRGDIPESEKRIQLLSTSFLMDAGEVLTNYIWIDPTIGNKTEFSFQWVRTPEGVQGIDVTVTQPDGTVYDSSYEGYQLNIMLRMLTLKIEGTAQPGSWNFAVHNVATLVEEVFCTITSHASDPDVEPITVTSELSGTVTEFLGGNGNTAVYAEVRQGMKAIIYAEVWATVHRPPFPSGVPAPDYNLQLIDNGSGCDVTKNDGIYSRCFTQFTADGFYGIKISVTNNGTALVVGPRPISRAIPNLDPAEGLKYIGEYPVLPPWTPPTEPTGEPAPPFTRSQAGGSTNVPALPPSYTPGQDIFPPGSIVDLKVANTSFEDKTVTLQWTSPGDDLDSGTVTFYDIRRASTATKLLDDFLGAIAIDQSDIILGNLSLPQEFGNIEKFIIKVPNERNDTTFAFSFAIQAVDDEGLTSEVSNVVQATLRQYIPPTGQPPTLPWTTSAPATTTSMLSTTILTSTSMTTMNKVEPVLTLWQIIGSAVAGFMVVLTVVLLVVALLCRKKQKSQKHRDDGDTGNNNVNIEGQINVAMMVNDYERNVIQANTEENHYMDADVPI